MQERLRCARSRLSFNVPKKDAATLDVPPGLLKANYESKVEWVARQIKDSHNQTGRLNILESYCHDFITVEEARETGDEVRASRHHADMERLNPILTASMTAVSRTEGHLGLAHRPKEHEVQVLLVREFRSLNDTLVLILDVLKAMIRP